MKSIDTDSLENGKNILLNADILVIADPRKDYSERVVKYIIEYIEAGGDMLITLEPDSNESVKPILKLLGVSLIPGSLSNSKSSDYEKDLMLAQFDSLSPLLPNAFIKDWTWRYNYPTTMPGAAGFEVLPNSDFNSHPFLIAREVHSTLDSLSNSPKDIPVALTLDRYQNGKTQRIFLAGDADFIGNKELDRKNIRNYNDKELVPYIFHWLTDETTI